MKQSNEQKRFTKIVIKGTAIQNFKPKESDKESEVDIFLTQFCSSLHYKVHWGTHQGCTITFTEPLPYDDAIYTAKLLCSKCIEKEKTLRQVRIEELENNLIKDSFNATYLKELHFLRKRKTPYLSVYCDHSVIKIQKANPNKKNAKIYLHPRANRKKVIKTLSLFEKQYSCLLYYKTYFVIEKRNSIKLLFDACIPTYIIKEIAKELSVRYRCKNNLPFEGEIARNSIINLY